MLEVKNVSYAYKTKKDKTILNNVSATFEEGIFYTIIGPSGAGKTTLLSLLAGLDTAVKGTVLCNGEDITKKGLSEAMNVVGDKFGSGKLFLPQVMLAAETMQAAFNTIKEIIPASDSLDKGTVVVATVKGDIHDLGKNIVAALLENNGYKIVDLGKDVDPEVIVQAIKDNKAALVGICSLMTTTMPQIDNTIAAIRAAGLKTKVMVGGAVVSQDYADQAGADIYAKDGIAAVNHANDFFETLK